ncbi:invasion associated locus B family protein [Xanthobacter sediminis]
MSRKVLPSARAGTALVWAAAALLCGGAMLPVPAARAETPAATETRSSHGDWIVRCKKDSSPKECEAVQTLQTADLKGTLAHVAVRAQKGGEVLLIVLTPPGVWLPANVTLKVGGVPDIVLTYKRCGQYCVASAALTPENITALKASAGQGDLAFENGSRNPIILPVSFKGLADALTASLKD